MAHMNGCNSHMGGMPAGKAMSNKSQPANATTRNSLSKGGVNTDLGGGAKSGYKAKLPAGKADANNTKGCC